LPGNEIQTTDNLESVNVEEAFSTAGVDDWIPDGNTTLNFAIPDIVFLIIFTLQVTVSPGLAAVGYENKTREYPSENSCDSAGRDNMIIAIEINNLNTRLHFNMFD
jgi:hypothetical protein